MKKLGVLAYVVHKALPINNRDTRTRVKESERESGCRFFVFRRAAGHDREARLYYLADKQKEKKGDRDIVSAIRESKENKARVEFFFGKERRGGL